eukprot:4533827-Alexandrium_andersonii.AAC.1
MMRSRRQGLSRRCGCIAPCGALRPCRSSVRGGIAMPPRGRSTAAPSGSGVVASPLEGGRGCIPPWG